MVSGEELEGFRARWAELTRRAQPAARPYSGVLKGEILALIDDMKALHGLSATERTKLEDSLKALDGDFASAALAGVGYVLDHRGV